MAIGGLAAQPAVASVIAGATSPEQVKANVAGGRWRPTDDDLAALDAVAPTLRATDSSARTNAVAADPAHGARGTHDREGRPQELSSWSAT